MSSNAARGPCFARSFIRPFAFFDTPFLFLLQNTDQRTTDFKYLTSKDQELSREIEVKIRKIERLQSSLQHWRTKVRRNTHKYSSLQH